MRRNYRAGETAKCPACGQTVRVYTHADMRWYEPHKSLAIAFSLSGVSMVNTRCRRSDTEVR